MMNVVALILQELKHRCVNALLMLVAVTTAVTLAVAFVTTADASSRETVRLSRDLGFNLRIIAKATDMDAFWRDGFADATLPERAVEQLAQYENVFLTYNHLVATLEGRIKIAGREVLLTGVSPAVSAPSTRQRPMGFRIEPGRVYVGHQVSRDFGLQAGGTLAIEGRSFRVERCLAESGTADDARVFVRLADAQELLGMPGRINEIKAIDCLCLTSDQDPLTVLRSELAKILPEAQVLQLRTLADARARQRQTSDRYFAFVLPLVLVVCALVVMALAMFNVRERRMEIGVLRALGHGTGLIAVLVLGRAALVGGVSGLAGFGLGSSLAVACGPSIFQMTASALRPEWGWLGWAMTLTPLFSIVASLVPATLALTQDPADVLNEP